RASDPTTMSFTVLDAGTSPGRPVPESARRRVDTETLHGLSRGPGPVERAGEHRDLELARGDRRPPGCPHHPGSGPRPHVPVFPAGGRWAVRAAETDRTPGCGRFRAMPRTRRAVRALEPLRR